MNNSNCVKSVRGSRLAGACSVLLAALRRLLDAARPVLGR